MIKKKLSLFVLTSCIAHQAYALTDDQLEPIRKLGEINGVALNCHYPKQAKLIKQSLVQSLPKLRGLGEMFEEETNRSFLEFIKSGEQCPGEATMEEMIRRTVDLMNKEINQSN